MPAILPQAPPAGSHAAQGVDGHGMDGQGDRLTLRG
ncbi:hypothetical protein P3T36_004184 [Kitasatospora sp. MAP12-15]|nr:hypothetical protein [Kitasatospora sp. MAP12-44]